MVNFFRHINFNRINTFCQMLSNSIICSNDDLRNKVSGNYDNIYMYIYKTGAIKFKILAFVLLKNNVKKPFRPRIPINCYFTANYILLLQDGLLHHHNIQEL